MLADQFEQAEPIHALEAITPDIAIQPTQSLTRLKTDWFLQHPYTPRTASITDNPLPESDNYFQRTVGTIIHQILAEWPTEQDAERLLQQHGICQTQMPQALDMINIALANTQHDPRAQWILNPGHHNIHCEYPVTAVIKGKVRHLVIDRVFESTSVIAEKELTHNIPYNDANSDICWIIDYKTATPGPLDLETFLQQERQLYQPQLEVYAQAMSSLTNLPIHVGLYFPLCKAWIDWAVRDVQLIA